MACYIGTAYSQVLQVSYNPKEAIDTLGEKRKNPIVSIYYDDEHGKSLTFADPKSATIAEFGSDLKEYPLAAAYQDPSIQVIGSYLLQESLLYFTTNTGAIILQDIQSQNPEQSNMIEPQLKKIDLKHFYRTTTRNQLNFTAFVGKGVLPFVYCHNSVSMIWKGKNVPNDELDLEVPIDDVDCTFLGMSQLAVANANDKIRIFDIRSNRKKPLFDHHLKLNDNTKSRMSKLETNTVGSDPYLYVGKENGSIYELDSRKNCQPTKKFKGSTTTIKDLKVTQSYVYSVSLDCFLRTFNKEERNLVSQRYLNAHPTCLTIPKKSEQSQQIYQVEQLQSEEEEEQKNKQSLKKVKQIRKRNKVGLRYLEVDENWADLKQEQLQAEEAESNRVKQEAKQNFSEEENEL